MTEVIIGIDISKDRLDVHRLPDGETAAFGNDKAGLKRLKYRLGTGVRRVVSEPTGRYHLALERRLAEAGYPLVKVNPRHAKRFGEALGARAKTDRADAVMLARMGLALQLEPRPIGTKGLRDLKDLIAARRALVKDRTAAKNRAKGIGPAIPRRRNADRLKRIGTDVKAIDAAIAELIAADETLSARHAILPGIPGISTVTAAALMARMPGPGALDQRAAASLAGLAPMTRQSGRWHGKTFIQGGRALVCEALPMPALVAARLDPDLKAVRDRLIAAGKPAKAAITAVMRSSSSSQTHCCAISGHGRLRRLDQHGCSNGQSRRRVNRGGLDRSEAERPCSARATGMDRMAELEFLVGTYTPPGGKGGGIHGVRVSTDAPEEAEPRLVAEAANPSWLTAFPGAGVVVAAEEVSEGARILTWRAENGDLTLLGEAEVPGAGPCHAGAHPSLPLVATAHYGDGTAALWHVAEGSGAPEILQRFAFDGSGPVSGRQEASHAHFATFLEDGRILAITDLGGDAIHFHSVDVEAEPVATHLQRLDLPPGSGPRHIAEAPGAFYVSCELDETVRTIIRQDGRFATVAELTPFSPVAGEGGALSGIRVSPDGTGLFVAGRNQSAIARLRIGRDGALEPDAVFDCGGRHPRDFAFHPDGRWMVVANQRSDALALFEIEPAGPIRPRGTVPIGSPACILFAPG